MNLDDLLEKVSLASKDPQVIAAHAEVAALGGNAKDCVAALAMLNRNVRTDEEKSGELSTLLADAENRKQLKVNLVEVSVAGGGTVTKIQSRLMGIGEEQDSDDWRDTRRQITTALAAGAAPPFVLGGLTGGGSSIHTGGNVTVGGLSGKSRDLHDR